MSAARSRRLVTAGGLSLALGLVAPSAALADHTPQHDPRGESSSAERGKAEPGKSSSSSSTGRSGASGKGGSTGKGSPSGQGGKGTSARGNGSQQSRPGSSDPRGNNGTVKIDGQTFDDGRGNEPHVGCVFSVDFYGFDAGDAATVTVTGQAPTGGGLLHSQHSTISDDAAGGGQDRDATLVLSVQDQLSELLSVAPHPQQGWHVKLAVDVDSAPGGAKQKVFWISCPQAPAVSGSTTEAAGGGTGSVTDGAGGTDVTIAKRNIAETPLTPSGGEAAALAGTTTQAAQGAAAERFGRVSAASLGQADAEAVAAQGAVRPQALPFTGAQALGALLALGLAALGAGGVAARLGSRRAAQG